MLQSTGVALAFCVDLGLNDEKEIVAVAQVVQRYADCGESKYEWSDTRVRDSWKLISGICEYSMRAGTYR